MLKPRFSNSLPANTPGRVLAGDEMFKTQTYYYASEPSGQILGTANGVLVTFAGTLGRTPIRKNTVQVTATIGSATSYAIDDGAGALTGPDVTAGTINYTTGAISVGQSNIAKAIVTTGNHLFRVGTKRVKPMTLQEQYAPPEDVLSDILTAMCHAVARTIELIPADRPDSRMMACAYALKEIVDTVQQSIVSEQVTTAPH